MAFHNTLTIFMFQRFGSSGRIGILKEVRKNKRSSLVWGCGETLNLIDPATKFLLQLEGHTFQHCFISVTKIRLLTQSFEQQ